MDFASWRNRCDLRVVEVERCNHCTRTWLDVTGSRPDVLAASRSQSLNDDEIRSFLNGA